jgi:hypothetical protein
MSQKTQQRFLLREFVKHLAVFTKLQQGGWSGCVKQQFKEGYSANYKSMIFLS